MGRKNNRRLCCGACLPEGGAGGVWRIGSLEEVLSEVVKRTVMSYERHSVYSWPKESGLFMLAVCTRRCTVYRYLCCRY